MPEGRARLVDHSIPESSGINMVPLMDVVFQLLLFFLLASALIRPNQIEIDLPDSTSGQKARQEQVVAVTYLIRNGRPEITLNARRVESLEELCKAMQAMQAPQGKPQPRVDILIDKTVPYQNVISLMDSVRDGGFPRFSLLTLSPARSGT